MKRLKVGLIGLGEVAEVHLEAYQKVKEIQVTAGAEIRKDRLSQISKKWEIEGYADYERMLESENLDIVCILTPPGYRKSITEKAAKFGCHVLSEKPMALNLDDARAMIEICRESGVRLCYGASYRYLSACQKAREMIGRGVLGDVRLLTETFVGGQGLRSWRGLGADHYPAGGPGGGGMGLMDHGIHLVDAFRWFTGSEVALVSGRGNYSGAEPAPEYLTMTFENGAIGQLVYDEATYPADLPSEGIYSWGGRWDHGGNLIPGGSWDPHPGCIRVHGTKAAMRVFYYANKLFLIGEEERQVEVPNQPMPENFALQMESFARCVLRNEKLVASGVEGYRALQIVLAAYESCETQRSIAIDRVVWG